jgi:hypothetical protein
LVSFFRPKASQLSDFGGPRASSRNDTPYESEITTARLKLKGRKTSMATLLLTSIKARSDYLHLWH